MYQKSLKAIKSQLQRFVQMSFFVLVILSLSRCNDIQKVQIPASPTLLSSTLAPTLETPQPTITPSSTATTTQQPTSTPVATLPVEIRKQNLIELFSTNGGCDFPCWWGISSGDSIQKVSELAPLVGKPLRAYGSSYYYILSLDNLNFADFDTNFFVDASQTVQRIEISINQPSRFRDYYDAFEMRLSLASLLGRYGKPSEVLLLVTPRFEPGETPRPYTLFLIYDTQDFGIVYSGLVDYENPLRICSIKLDDYHLQYVMLYLINPRSKIVEINRFNSTELQPLEQVTSMSLDDFYQIFTNPKNNQCIDVPIDVWQ